MTEPARPSPTLHTAIATVVHTMAADILTAASDRMATKARILESEGHPTERVAGWHEAAAWQRHQARENP